MDACCFSSDCDKRRMSEDGSGQIDDNDEEEASGIEFSLTNVG